MDVFSLPCKPLASDLSSNEVKNVLEKKVLHLN